MLPTVHGSGIAVSLIPEVHQSVAGCEQQRWGVEGPVLRALVVNQDVLASSAKGTRTPLPPLFRALQLCGSWAAPLAQDWESSIMHRGPGLRNAKSRQHQVRPRDIPYAPPLEQRQLVPIVAELTTHAQVRGSKMPISVGDCPGKPAHLASYVGTQ